MSVSFFGSKPDASAPPTTQLPLPDGQPATVDQCQADYARANPPQGQQQGGQK